ncbi:MAG: class I SAM-dependent methyltransferase [Chthoniobacterales bacterium]
MESAPAAAKTGRNDIVFLSDPLPQPDQHSYFDLVSFDHFWVARRFEVLRKLAGSILKEQRRFCEIGCGNGILQRQLELDGVDVDGIEVSMEALQHNYSRDGTLYCYDIFEKHPSLREKYDGVLLFDVLEHIVDDAAFLRAATFHLKPGGHVLINVPARPELFSAYDRAAGHRRRYNKRALLQLMNKAGLRMVNYTYWGLPLYPVLVARKMILGTLYRGRRYTAGFRPAGAWVNSIMRIVSRLEYLPQRILGISLLGVAVKDSSK